MKIKMLVIFLFLIVNVASASNVTINGNKHLVLDGVEIFPTSMATLCSFNWDNVNGGDSCSESFDKLDNFTIAFQHYFANDSRDWLAIKDAVNHSVYWNSIDDRKGNYFTENYLNNPFFQGWWIYYTGAQHEEPDNTAELDMALLEYNSIKTYEVGKPNHPVSLTTFSYKMPDSSRNVSEATDIIYYDGYTLKTNCGSNTTFYYAPSTGCQYDKIWYNSTEFIYAWERDISNKFGTSGLSVSPDPVFIHMQAYGVEWNEGATRWRLQTKEQMRAETYFAVIMGAKGVSWWGNKISAGSTRTYGLEVNDTRAAYHNNLAGEIISQSMQQILLLPILNSSWNGALGWDGKVVFGTNPTRKIYTPVENIARNQLAYAYKMNVTTNKKYIIVVNKYLDPITTTVTISGLSGTLSATTIGQDGTGSSAPGVVHVITNGVFSDVFDGYAAHIYEISSTKPAPIVDYWGNTKTGDNNTHITLNVSESITFNATANQTVTTWNWYNNGQDAGNNTNSYTFSFLIGGTKNITLGAANANGSSNMITWTISVLSPSSTNSTPTIISRGNTKTRSDLTSLNLNTSEIITFNATANQTITTWNWYNNGQSAGNNTNSYTVSFSTEGIKNISVRAANANGSSNMITWNVSVSPTSSIDPKIGIGGVGFSPGNSNFNHTVLNKGDGKVTIGLFADNCDDGTGDWSAGTCIRGKLTGSNSTYTTLRQNVSEYTNVTIFFETVEYGITPWTADARGHTSRASINQRYQVYKNTTHDLLGYMPLTGASTWLSNAATTRNINTVWYNILDLNGNNLKFYSRTGSFAKAFSSVNLSATNSSYPAGNFFLFWVKNMTLDNIRMIESGRNTGSITVYYDSGTNNQTKSLIVNATTPTNTNYTVSYRQKYTGSWIPIGGTYTGNQSLPITGTKYQDTEIKITLYGNSTSFPDIETVEFIREQTTTSIEHPRYDVNENGTVEINDLILVGQYFNKAVSFPYPRYDVNMDGLVNINDLSIVGKHFGEHV